MSEQALSAARHEREAERLAALHHYRVLDTPREDAFDDLASIASEICGTPIAVVSLVDQARQWFKAEVGLGIRETPLDVSFCTHALLQDDLLLVPDATSDPRFSGNPLVTGQPGLRFYAGAPLKTASGLPIGTLCVLDTQPRQLDERQIEALRRLARQVMSQLELRLALEERGEAERRLRALNADLEQQVIERSHALGRTWQVSPDILGVLDADSHFERSNPAWGTILGWTAEEVAARPFFDFLHPDDVDRTRLAWEEVRQGQPLLRFENRYRSRDGGYRWLSWVAVPEGDDVYCSARDITIEKDREAELAASRAERDRLWELSEDLLVVADYEGRLIRVSASWTRLLGHDEATLLARPYGEIIHRDDVPVVADSLATMRATGTTVSFDDRVLAADGAWRWIAWTLSPEPGGRRLTGVGRDVTDAKAHRAELDLAQESLRQAQKMEAVGQLTGGVAHDFNNLLTIIKSSTDLLRRPDLSDARRTRYVEAISDTVDRAARLTGQLLAFARRQALKPEVFEVGARLRDIAEMLGTMIGARIRMTTDLDAGPCFVEADASQFETALVNLVVNARDAMDGEGTLTIRVGTVREIPAIRLHAREPVPSVAISVTDTGTGIPADRLVQIFEPFFTTKGVGKGTGLGLSQVFGFAKQSGGDVEVASEPGRGSTFTLYLPQVEAGRSRPAPSLHRPAAQAETGGGRRVLVVEDNVEVGTFSTQLLQDLGYETTWAANGTEALAILEREGEFHVVFSDVVMPGMSGLELGQEIRRRRPDMPVVLTSGYSQTLAHEGRHGFELLQKPYAVEDLSRTLSRAVARHDLGLPR